MPFWARSGWCKAGFLFCAVCSKILRGDEVIVDRYLVQARRETMTKENLPSGNNRPKYPRRHLFSEEKSS